MRYSTIIIFLLLLFMFNSAYSQDNKNNELISVRLDIVGKGAPTICAKVDKFDYYFATVTISNTQDTTIKFCVMSCSWAMDGFFINNDSIRFESCFRGCDKNVPESIVLPPKKSVQFYGTIGSGKRDHSSARIRVGLRYFSTVDELWDFELLNERENPNRMVWSNEVELKDNLYSYEIK